MVEQIHFRYTREWVIWFYIVPRYLRLTYGMHMCTLAIAAHPSPGVYGQYRKILFSKRDTEDCTITYCYNGVCNCNDLLSRLSCDYCICLMLLLLTRALLEEESDRILANSSIDEEYFSQYSILHWRRERGGTRRKSLFRAIISPQMSFLMCESTKEILLYST